MNMNQIVLEKTIIKNRRKLTKIRLIALHRINKMHRSKYIGFCIKTTSRWKRFWLIAVKQAYSLVKYGILIILLTKTYRTSKILSFWSNFNSKKNEKVSKESSKFSKRLNRWICQITVVFLLSFRPNCPTL